MDNSNGLRPGATFEEGKALLNAQQHAGDDLDAQIKARDYPEGEHAEFWL